ncbi:dihydroneopterin aldolase [Chthoniobacter flavus Ellin428]|uniref:dihydroneopterin aldolase n=1 Tax=Chthoniobacter flavus Ellin428 TaxID=497964 RepID=B4D0F1_9BACT|nr:dihydroneopterin aldolase [Chthoniobacter flavus]EDY19813.1 dihydroneopterin aldolase [Chthoniobacter flavus Ellin428]TCO91913.1 dihydroneopterin aldolase [Chthoniobacter flavus]
MADSIRIESLELRSYIGVPAEERAATQRLTVSLVLEPVRDFRALDDRIENTVDYFDVGNFVKALSLSGPRQLIETLAEEIAGQLLARYPLRAVEVELRKYILPDTAFVAVQLRREREAG